MDYELFGHPLASYCMKVVVGLYEAGIEFENRLVDLGDAAARATFLEISPFGKMPALRDRARDAVVLESTGILEYLAGRDPRAAPLVPPDRDAALEARKADRFFDNYVMNPMQKIVGDKLRPPGQADPFGVEEARATLATAYAVADAGLVGRTWAAGEAFTMGDCAAAPALFFAAKVAPIPAEHARLHAYVARLSARPSFARVITEAGPYMKFFPG